MYFDVYTTSSKCSFAAVLCQPLFPKNIPRPKNRQVHGSSPPMNVAVFFAYPAGLDPGGYAQPN